MGRLRGQGRFTLILRNFSRKRNILGGRDLASAMIVKALSLVVCSVGFVIVVYSTLATSKLTLNDRQAVRSKIYYRRVVEYVGYEDIVYFPSDKIDEMGGSERVHRRAGRRLLTKDLLSPKIARAGDKLYQALRRARRGYITETEHYSEYRRQRSSDSDSPIQTVTVVRGNDIKSRDIEEHETKEETDVQNPVIGHGETHPGRNLEDLSEMELVYLKAVETCEPTNATNSSSHSNTSSHDDEHGGKCAAEMASSVPGLWVLLYVAIILFLFIGLAIICDDFFIASLEAISERLKLSEDVAGATFMAAGSSAPELFISIAGAGAGSDVGVGTIVGSAVFNLLIIIALTAALAGKVLCLDWRPFVRDSIFYSLSIVAFIIFSMDTQFQFWESLLLLALYALYIVVMKFNPQLMACMAKWNCCSCFESRVSPAASPEVSKDSAPQTSATVIPKTVFQPPDAPKAPTKSAVSPNPGGSSRQAATPVETIPPPPPIQKQTTQTAAATAQTKPPPTTLQPTTSKREPQSSKKRVFPNGYSGTCTCGSTEMTSQPQICTCCVIHISSQPCLACSPTASPRLNGIPRIRCSSCSSINEEVLVVTDAGPGSDNTSANIFTDSEDRNTYLPNIANVDLQKERSASTITLNSAQTTDSINRNSNNSSASEGSQCNGANGDIKVISESFEENPSVDDGAPSTREDKEGDGEGDEPQIIVLPCLPAIKNSPPEKPNSSRCIAGSKYVLLYGVYLLSFPWVCAFTWTVPKCDTPQKRKWYLLSFLVCIIWIALVSWIMIELVEKIGCLLNIDTYTMGLIVVAVGTSVPDAISSVLVAKEGYGDMAVSNALGSNVFDINLGLGLPFFLGSIITSKPISLMSPLQMCLFETLPLPIRIVPHVKFGLILLLVLVIAVAVFMFFRFRLNKQVTILFIVMYVAFMIYAFVQEKKCYSFFC